MKNISIVISVGKKETPREFWSKAQTTEWWKNQDARYGATGKNDESEAFLLNLVEDRDPERILEVGAGTGRLIGAIKRAFPVTTDAHSADINEGLCKLIEERHPGVTTHHLTETSLPFKDKEFDFAYTYQVLQHMPGDVARAMVAELMRVAKTVLIMEGYVPGAKDGDMTHPANGGSYYNDYGQILAEHAGIRVVRTELHEGKIRCFLFDTP